MARKNLEGLKKHTVHLFEGQKEQIERLYPQLTFADALRQIIKVHVKKKLDELPKPKANVNIEGLL